MVGGTKIKGPIIAHEVDQMNYIGCSVLCSRGEVLLSTAPEGRFLHRFGLKRVYILPIFVRGIGYGLRRELRLCINVFVVSFPK